MNRNDRIRRWLATITGGTLEGGLESAGSGLEAVEADRERIAAWAGAEGAEGEGALDALDGLIRGDEVPDEDLDGLEAIILPKYRPAIDVIHSDYADPPSPWKHLADPAVKQVLKPTLRSIGRVEVPNHPVLPYAGTGFVVGDGLLMTNRHVALLFAQGAGVHGLRFLPGQTAGVDFAREIVPSTPVLLEVTEVVMIHPYWDMALLRVRGDLAPHAALQLDPTHPDDLAGKDVAVIGYPGQDQRNALDVQNRIFRGVFQVKRLQPGHVTGRGTVESYGRAVDALTHDASTLGGNSGSAVISLASGGVVGLHFAGRYLESNFAVPAFELAGDPRVVDAGVRFAKNVAPSGAPWIASWDSTNTTDEAPLTWTRGAAVSVAGTATTAVVGADLLITLPLEITLDLGVQEPR